MGQELRNTWAQSWGWVLGWYLRTHMSPDTAANRRSGLGPLSSERRRLRGTWPCVTKSWELEMQPVRNSSSCRSKLGLGAPGEW